ncbi:MAG: hypothetical protein ISS00_02095 [Candidatus Marinimicrobia bacterium]|nr:hypothetical protein [Candidatus Neomarinimicrobiota bacterium]
MKNRTLEEILADETHGATTLFIESLDYFLCLDDKNFVTRITEESEKLQKHFTAMGLFQRLHVDVLKMQEKGKIISQLQNLKGQILQNTQNLVSDGANVFPRAAKILTISYSSLVRDVIVTARKNEKNPHVFCLRSAPKNEGELLCQNLESVRVSCQLIEDDFAKNSPENIDLILLGCDMFSDNFFINKTGSAELVKSVSENNIPVWILGDSLRYVSGFSEKFPTIFEKIDYENNCSILSEFGLTSVADFLKFAK